MRLIDADALEPHEVYMNYGCQRIVYMDDIDEMPTIDAEPVRHGKWTWEECVYKCSECSHKAYGNILECMDGTYKYCPNCGARMEIEENERNRAK